MHLIFRIRVVPHSLYPHPTSLSGHNSRPSGNLLSLLFISSFQSWLHTGAILGDLKNIYLWKIPIAGNSDLIGLGYGLGIASIKKFLSDSNGEPGLRTTFRFS